MRPTNCQFKTFKSRSPVSTSVVNTVAMARDAMASKELRHSVGPCGSPVAVHFYTNRCSCERSCQPEDGGSNATGSQFQPRANMCNFEHVQSCDSDGVTVPSADTLQAIRAFGVLSLPSERNERTRCRQNA